MWLSYFQLNRVSMIGARKPFTEEAVATVPLMRYDVYYHQMPDGTVKQINPFNGTEVWSVPGRAHKPLDYEAPEHVEPLEPKEKEDVCSFCETRYFETPPEKFRLICQNGRYQKLHQLPASQYFNTKAEFRRVPNLFEILSLDYWRLNYNFRLTKAQLEWREKYLSEPEGMKHVLNVIDYKLSKLFKSPDEIKSISIDEKLAMADAFFGGSHELIIAGRHYKRGATHSNQLFSSGEMTPEEHEAYFTATVDALRDIYANNRYVRYVSVFQNWLKPAGASFDHLHKQLVGLDSWSISIENQVQMVRANPNVFNEYGPNLAIHYNLVFAENDYAIAYSAIGHRFPTIAIYSKAANARPQDHTAEELRGMSDLVHACHAAMGSAISCNEEWYYTPIDSVYNMPWKILIKWRINIPAGFEGNTNIYINPISPIELRDKMVPRLYEARQKGLVAKGIAIAEECPCRPNSLKYYMR
jgi:galactose-1-phosphate uridylyltransferase